MTTGPNKKSICQERTLGRQVPSTAEGMNIPQAKAQGKRAHCSRSAGNIHGAHEQVIRDIFTFLSYVALKMSLYLCIKTTSEPTQGAKI